jgi:hypothetical protein
MISPHPRTIVFTMRLAQADTLMRLIKADSLEEAERMLSDVSIQQLVQEHNQKMRGAQ